MVDRWNRVRLGEFPIAADLASSLFPRGTYNHKARDFETLTPQIYLNTAQRQLHTQQPPIGRPATSRHPIGPVGMQAAAMATRTMIGTRPLRPLLHARRPGEAPGLCESLWLASRLAHCDGGAAGRCGTGGGADPSGAVPAALAGAAAAAAACEGLRLTSLPFSYTPQVLLLPLPLAGLAA